MRTFLRCTRIPPCRPAPRRARKLLCANRQFSHDGYETAYRGLGYRTRGENLAMGHTDARSVHAQLMGSPGHRANILRREFDSVGVGSACSITVELFGGR